MTSGVRTLVSYDDMYQASPPQSPSHKPPPAKKRKWNKNSKGRNTNNHQRHTNAIGQVPASSKTVADIEMEEGRDLTHDEIWDDSALIDAWNAAAEEYEAFHGPDKGWKKEPIHNSPLWYNTPKVVGKNNHTGSNGKIPILESDEQENSRPLDFETFMPSHNPALDVSPTLVPENPPQFLLDASRCIVSQDEAFTRALGAMYWSGYWTAMYHAQRQIAQKQSAEDEVQQGEEDFIDEDEGEEEEQEEQEEAEEEHEDAFVSTQR
ncbi:hypothetical protein C0995_005578 [Termitomyces sp. Mi166|nr:hypothetical protein C0995_005578 [Termitomyces sp. Mi166\